jgi:LmbE family N-acetylglucosaminyl deacetylase
MAEEREQSRHWVAMAVGAHPDDIEFMMAGTLLLLKGAGAEIHMWNLANGSCGTTVYAREDIIRIRAEEAHDSARVAGAVLHAPLVDDLAIYYEPALAARTATVVRAVKPDILLIPSPQDYMEDHQNTCRLLVTAAFVRGMRNFVTSPPTEPWLGDTVLYHATPHTLRDPLRRRVRPETYVDVGSVRETKREMLAQHRSQKEWLDATQGLDAYLLEMDRIDREVGVTSGRYEFAEGWRRHCHVGFGPDGWDPLAELLSAACWADPEYENNLG